VERDRRTRIDDRLQDLDQLLGTSVVDVEAAVAERGEEHRLRSRRRPGVVAPEQRDRDPEEADPAEKPDSK
jgi:hypothetical protein